MNGLMPDCGGAIEAVAMTVPLRLLMNPADGKGAALARLAEAWPRGVTLYLLIDDPEAAEFRAWANGLSLSCDLVPVSTGKDAPLLEAEVWTQDSFMVARENERRILRHLIKADRPGRHASWLAPVLGAELSATDMVLAGGNTLTGPDFRLVGAASLARTPLGQGPAAHAAFDARRLHVFGFALTQRGAPPRLAQQPHHIDLVVSVTGCSDRDGRPILLVADPRKSADPDGPRMEGWAEQMDASARRLEEDGFTILRNKVPFLANPGFAPNPALRAYNNVAVENEVRAKNLTGRPRIWLPQFGDAEATLADFDTHNREIWQNLGFDVIGVYGWSAFVRSGGAIRCASKVVSRWNPIAKGVA
ncbi:hypothetical protein [Dongia sp.]|uniref:hypothetical protein n=1 Tax=Dongia sp. TaxID=1977262 RepID=UPI0035B2319B